MPYNNGRQYQAIKNFSLSTLLGHCPCWMPQVKIKNGDQTIGIVRQDCCPGSVFQYKVQIYKGSEANQVTLHRVISRCSINLHTCCSVACCGLIGKELVFHVKDAQGRDQESFKKIYTNCFQEFMTAGDGYQLTLPANEDDAALMLAAVQFIDMLYFENPYICCQP